MCGVKRELSKIYTNLRPDLSSLIHDVDYDTERSHANRQF